MYGRCMGEKRRVDGGWVDVRVCPCIRCVCVVSGRACVRECVHVLVRALACVRGGLWRSVADARGGSWVRVARAPSLTHLHDDVAPSGEGELVALAASEASEGPRRESVPLPRFRDEGGRVQARVADAERVAVGRKRAHVAGVVVKTVLVEVLGGVAVRGDGAVAHARGTLGGGLGDVVLEAAATQASKVAWKKEGK